jgi:DNA phosphorothioation-dependent restriction protein DptG
VYDRRTFAVGDYKKRPNLVGGHDTTKPKDVPVRMKKLLDDYNEKQNVTVNDIIAFHAEFEKIHPFQDGNGRVGRLIMFKECLKHNITPFIIDEQHKMFYYRGLKEWNTEKGFLRDTVLSCQDKFYEILKYFRLDKTLK